jgi:putative oxidoreductase
MFNTARGASSSVVEDSGKLMLRLLVGVLLLLHGIAKMKGGVDGIVQMVSGAGFPGVFAYLVYVGEVLAPLLIIVGLWTRPAALVATINMVVAVLLTQPDKVFALNKFGGWAIELEGFYLFGALAIALLGAGRFGVGGTSGKFN